MKHLLSFLAFCTLTSFVFVQSSQASVNRQEADFIKEGVKELFDIQREAYQKIGGRMIFDGDVLIEPAGNYYALTVPPIKLIDRAGNRGEIGMIAMNIAPTNNPDKWKVSTALPSPIRFFNDKNQMFLSIEIGSQFLGGVWYNRLYGFENLNADYKDLVINEPLLGRSTKIDALSIQSTFDYQSDNTVSGPFKITIDNLVSEGSVVPYRIAIGKTELDFDLSDVTLISDGQISENLQSASFGSLTNLSLGLYDSLFYLMERSANGYKSQVTFHDMEITLPQFLGILQSKTSAKKVSFGTDFTGFQNNDVTIGLNTNFEVLSVEDSEGNKNEILPQDGNIAVSIENVPFKDLVDFGRKSFIANGQDDFNPIAAVQALMVLPYILSKSQTHVEIKDSFLQNDLFEAKANADFTADANSMIGATGKANLEITGLQETLNALNTDNSDQNLDSLITFLQFLNTFGQRDANTGATNFSVEINQKGETTLNGQNMNLLGTQNAKEDTPE